MEFDIYNQRSMFRNLLFKIVLSISFLTTLISPQISSATGGDFLMRTNFNDVRGVHYDSNGFIYIYENWSILKLTPSGDLVSQLYLGDSLVGSIEENPDTNELFALGRVGLYRIEKDLSLKTLVLGDESMDGDNMLGGLNARFGYPVDFAFGLGRIYVADGYVGRVKVYDANDFGYLSSFSAPNATGIAIDFLGNLYVGVFNNYISVHDAYDNSYLRSITVGSVIGMDVDEHGNLYTIDYQGTELKMFPIGESFPSQAITPTTAFQGYHYSLSVDSFGDIYVGGFNFLTKYEGWERIVVPPASSDTISFSNTNAFSYVMNKSFNINVMSGATDNARFFGTGFVDMELESDGTFTGTTSTISISEINVSRLNSVISLIESKRDSIMNSDTFVFATSSDGTTILSMKVDKYNKNRSIVDFVENSIQSVSVVDDYGDFYTKFIDVENGIIIFYKSKP